MSLVTALIGEPIGDEFACDEPVGDPIGDEFVPIGDEFVPIGDEPVGDDPLMVLKGDSFTAFVLLIGELSGELLIGELSGEALSLLPPPCPSELLPCASELLPRAPEFPFLEVESTSFTFPSD
jgi:hypothetical protein